MALERVRKAEILAPSFDKLRMRSSDINGLHLMVRLSRFGRLTVRPWAASFFSNLVEIYDSFMLGRRLIYSASAPLPESLIMVRLSTSQYSAWVI